MCETAGKAGISTKELRGIVFGTLDPDVMTVGAIAHALDLKPSIEILSPEKSNA